MLWMRSRVALLTLVTLTGMSNFVRADDCCAPSCCAPICCTKKICVTEYVPEHYQATRTVYKTEWKEEAYTSYKTECVPEVRTRTFTVNHMVTECRDEVRTVTKYVPTV